MTYDVPQAMFHREGVFCDGVGVVTGAMARATYLDN